MNKSEEFLSDEENQELIYRCDHYQQIEAICSKRRLEWREFKAALPMIGLDYDKMKEHQDAIALMQLEKEREERRKQAAEREILAIQEREKREILRTQQDQLRSMLDSGEVVKKVTVADIQAFIKENINDLADMSYGALYYTAKKNGFCNSGFLFNQYKQELKFYGIDYEKLREQGKKSKDNDEEETGLVSTVPDPTPPLQPSAFSNEGFWQKLFS